MMEGGGSGGRRGKRGHSRSPGGAGTWLEMRSSHTDRAIWMALGLWVTEVALSWIFQEPCRLLAWFTASRNICSCFRVLSTAPILTILGSQEARAKEQEKSRASVSKRMVLMGSGQRPGSGQHKCGALGASPAGCPGRPARARSRGLGAPRLSREPESRDVCGREGGPRAPPAGGVPGACVPALALALPLSAVLKRFPALPWAPGAERTPGGGSSRASLVRFPTLRRLRQLRSRERGQRLLPLPPPPLPNTEPKGGRLPRLSVRLRSCEHSSGCAGAGSACVRVCVRVQVCACARVSVCVGVAGTVTWLSRSCRELSPCHCVQPCISFNMTERVPVCVCVCTRMHKSSPIVSYISGPDSAPWRPRGVERP